jgi:REP element-mobilizing transposase RayT
MREWPPWEIFPYRGKPHRLPRPEYQKVLQPVFFAACTKDRRAVLLRDGVPEAVRSLLDGNARQKGCAIIAYTLMPEHLHVLACVVRDGGDVLSFFEGFKRGSANQALKMGFTDFWQRDFWDRHTRNAHDLTRCIRYVLWNAVEEHLCEDPHDRPWTEFRGWPWDLVQRENDGHVVDRREGS